jgi:hypothetical protein
MSNDSSGEGGPFTPNKRPSSTRSRSSLHSTPRSTNSHGNSPWDDVGGTSTGGGKMNRRISRLLSRESGDGVSGDTWGTGSLPQQQRQEPQEEDEDDTTTEIRKHVRSIEYSYSARSIASVGGGSDGLDEFEDGMMGVDEDGDDVIESELFLRCVWTEPANSSPLGGANDTAVVSHDVDGMSLVTIHTVAANTAQLLRVEKRFTAPSATASSKRDESTSASQGDTADSSNDTQDSQGDTDAEEQDAGLAELLMLSIPSVRVTMLGR